MTQSWRIQSRANSVDFQKNRRPRGQEKNMDHAILDRLLGNAERLVSESRKLLDARTNSARGGTSGSAAKSAAEPRPRIRHRSLPQDQLDVMVRAHQRERGDAEDAKIARL